MGAGFAGLECAKILSKNRLSKNLEIKIIDRKNYHLFQPLLYQVAVASLAETSIASPIRSLLPKLPHVNVSMGEVISVKPEIKKIYTDYGVEDYDLLVMACGAQHHYFGREEWETYAPGLKTLEQGIEIRRRIFHALETADRLLDEEQKKPYQTFVIIGAGPTGVEIAGALGEVNKNIVKNEYKNLDPKKTKIILCEAGPSILSNFHPKLSKRAESDLMELGIAIRLNSKVTHITKDGVQLGNDWIPASTVIWAAGIKASLLNECVKNNSKLDQQGRIEVNQYLQCKNDPSIFILGDQALCLDQNSNPLPGLASVAVQQGKLTAKNILNILESKPLIQFDYVDKGKLATIGRMKAIGQFDKQRIMIQGKIAWILWLTVHIFFLSSLKNKIFVFMQWAWSFFIFGKGARLILGKHWEIYK